MMERAKFVSLVDIQSGKEIDKIPLWQWQQAFREYAAPGVSNAEIAAILLRKPKIKELLIDAIIIDNS